MCRTFNVAESFWCAGVRPGRPRGWNEDVSSCWPKEWYFSIADIEGGSSKWELRTDPRWAPNSQLPSMMKVGRPEVVGPKFCVKMSDCNILRPKVWLCYLSCITVYTVQMYDISLRHAENNYLFWKILKFTSFHNTRVVVKQEAKLLLG